MNGETMPYSSGGNEKKVDGLQCFYPEDVETIRDREYPLLKGTHQPSPTPEPDVH